METNESFTLKEALSVANLNGSIAPRQPMKVIRFRRGAMIELLCRCKYFQVENYLRYTKMQRTGSGFKREVIPSCIALFGGMRRLYSGGTEVEQDFFRGDCIFVPAGIGKI